MKYVPRIIHEIELEYVRSRGPGGQHVNKTNSAVLLRWNFRNSYAFTDEEKYLIQEKLKNLATTDGDLIFRADEFRDQDSNRKKCFEKLDSALEKAFFVHKKRKATKPTRSSQRKRQDEKRHRGKIKSGRGRVSNHED